MDDVSKPSRSDTGRETRQALLLRRLAQTLRDLRQAGVVGPNAFEGLVQRNSTARPPAR